MFMRRYRAAIAGALLLCLLSGYYAVYQAGERAGARRTSQIVPSAAAGPRPVAQHSRTAPITLRAEQDEDGPYIVVSIPWRTLCATGLRLPPEQAADCADAKASNGGNIEYILPTDDDDDNDDDGPHDQATAWHRGL